MKDICNILILEYDQAQPQSGKIVSKKFKTCKYREGIFKIGKTSLSKQYSFIPNLETSQYFFSMVSIEPELDVTKQKMKVKKEKKKKALSQRVLYKISHLTIFSLVVISDKRRGQVNLYHQLETIHLKSENSLVRQ